ncbi:MAG: hypothetical protein ABIB12_03115 [Patescibacteria group bacterium]
MGLILRGNNYGGILGASGVQGFFGEGYWYHRYLKPWGLNFEDMTFVAKTATYAAREGNMPLTPEYTPQERFPECIGLNPISGLVLNAVGLSNPGLEALLEEPTSRKWQQRTKPFMISVASLGSTPQARVDEMRKIAALIAEHRDSFRAPFGVQINLSCPNTEEDPRELVRESWDILTIMSEAGVPLMPKYSIDSAPIEAMLELQQHPACDAICVSNTLPFGWDGIDWKHVLGSDKSPLAHLGGGGLSGKVLLPLVCKWIARLRKAGFTKPINGGGGILSAKDAERYRDAGASSVFLGSVAFLRPWRSKGIIAHANTLTWEEGVVGRAAR